MPVLLCLVSRRHMACVAFAWILRSARVRLMTCKQCKLIYSTVSSIYFWSKNSSHSAYEKSEVKTSDHFLDSTSRSRYIRSSVIFNDTCYEVCNAMQSNGHESYDDEQN
jgi:hypothetical protein